MNRLASMLPEYLVVMGLYGVGESFGPQLMAEIDDVRRSERKQALVAFTGIGPMPNQSRVKNVRSNKSPKRGAPYLRKTLFSIMMYLCQTAPADEPVFQFLDRKRNDGTPYYVYMTARANKFLRRYYAKVRDYLATLDDLPPVDIDSTGLPPPEPLDAICNLIFKPAPYGGFFVLPFCAICFLYNILLSSPAWDMTYCETNLFCRKR